MSFDFMVGKRAANIFVIILIASAYVLLYISSFVNFLLFHTAAELFSIGIALAVFAIGWVTSEYVETRFYTFIGCAFLSVAVIDLIHTLAYSGMNLFPGYDANLPTQLWIIGRYLLSISLLAAPFIHKYKDLSKYIIGLTFLAVTTILIIIVFAGFFPDCYIEGSGLTQFKIVSEYVIILILFCSALLFYRDRVEYDKVKLQCLIGAIIFTMIGELAFTFYVDVYGFSNLVGHFMKITAFGLIYIAILHVSIKRPFSSLFKSIQEKEQEVREINETLRITGKMLRHDMTNQLHILNSIIELQGDSCEEFEMALRVVGRCQQLIRDAKILSDVAGSAEDLSPYSLRETILESLETFHIDYSIEGEGTVYGDRTLVSAISNLIQNSVIHSGTNKIDITIEEQGDLCEIQIIDYGSGIPKEILGTLFQQGVKHGATGGTGMGLYIASTIINRLEGNITFKQNHPTGSIFIIHLRTA